MTDLYQVLGVQPDSEDVVIRGAYNALMKKYHPDVYSGDKAYALKKAQEINAAFEILGDPVKRAQYDARNSFSRDKDTTNSSSTEARSHPEDKPHSNASGASADFKPTKTAPSESGLMKFFQLMVGLPVVLLIAVAIFAGNGAKTPPRPTAATPIPIPNSVAANVPREDHAVPALVQWDFNKNGNLKQYSVGDIQFTG